MLKLEDINSEELEKFHILEFVDLYTEKFTGYVGYMIDETGENRYILETDNNKIIQTISGKEGMELLYKLIQAGLVKNIE